MEAFQTWKAELAHGCVFEMDCTDGRIRELMDYKLYQPSTRNMKLTKRRSRPVAQVVYSNFLFLKQCQEISICCSLTSMFSFYNVECSVKVTVQSLVSKMSTNDPD